MPGAARHLVLIGGSQRSGTTLAQTLICNALPDVPVLAENGLLVDLIRAYTRATRKWNKTSGFYETPEDLRRFIADTIERHIADIAKRIGDPPFMVLKQPFFAGLMPAIAELLPEATLILCVRDPRDIVASYMKIGTRDSKRGAHNQYARRDVMECCRRINEAYNPTDGSDVQLHELRYEETVKDVPAALARLAASTKLPLRAPDLDKMTWLAKENRHQESWITDLEERAPSDESVGNFKTILSKGEIALTERICAKSMRRFGYTPVATMSAHWMSSLTWTRSLLRMGVSELRKVRR